MPVGGLALLAGLIAPNPIGRETEVGDWRTAGGKAQLGHCVHIANQLDSVDCGVGCHEWCLLLCRSSRLVMW
jgi:hypothetical protein